MKLNLRQRKFAEYYAQSGNIVQSAIKAGYSEKYANADACKILENPRVAEYIREISEKMQDERILTAKERQAILSDIIRDANHVEPSDRIRAIDVLNKMQGDYISKVEVSGTLNAEMSKLDTLVKQMNNNV
jgi:phage terminase small subunit